MMSRYIDPIWLYENIREQAPQFAELLKDLILVAPSIDIVCCGKCKHRINDDSFVSGHICLKRRANGGAFCEDNDFCSYGERNDE